MRFGLTFVEGPKERGLGKEWYIQPPPHLLHPVLSIRKRTFWVWQKQKQRRNGHMKSELRAGCNVKGKTRDYGEYNWKSGSEPWIWGVLK